MRRLSEDTKVSLRQKPCHAAPSCHSFIDCSSARLLWDYSKKRCSATHSDCGVFGSKTFNVGSKLKTFAFPV